MTQTRLGFTLTIRVAAWATSHDGARFWELCDAMGEPATEVDVAARSVGALRWVDGRVDVCSPGTGKE